MQALELEGLYDGVWFLHNNKPVILLFGRNEKGEKYILLEENFKPYFIISKDEARQVNKNVKFEIVEKEDVMSGRKDLVKIIYDNPSQTYTLRQNFEKHWEADILFINRFVIDKVKQKPGRNKLFYFDIETTSTFGFPDYKNPVEKIISISLYNNFSNKYILWIWHDKYKRETQIKKERFEYEVRRFENEKSMLLDFFQYLMNEKPDYLLAWNALFDWNYTIARLKALNYNIEMLSPIYKLKIEKGWNIQLVKFMDESAVSGKMRIGGRDEGYWKVVGLEFFDLLQGFKNIYGKELVSYSLDAVAQEILGEKKLQTHFDIEKKWKEDPTFIEKYNIIDTYLIVEIDKKIGIMKRFMGFKILSNLLILRDVFASGRILDNFILTKFKDKYAFPTKGQIRWDNWKWGTIVTGGFVRTPKPGLYENVVVFDFSGMYPNIMKTFNLGADSLVAYDFEKVDKDAEEQPNKPQLPEKFDGWIHLNTQKVKGKVKINFSKRAVITQILDEMIAERKKVKKERDKYEPGTPEYEALDTLQFSYKFVINASYGVNAYPGFRLFSPIIANTITTLGRMLIKWVGNRVEEEFGWKWIYSDTDSCFFLPNEKYDLQDENDRKRLLEKIEEVENKINNIFIKEFLEKQLPSDQIENATLKMELAEIFEKLILVTKKRYIGRIVNKEGKWTDNIFYMGLDLKRANNPQIIKDAQFEVAKAILYNEDWKEVVNKYYNIFKNENKEVLIEMLKIPTKLEKPIEEYKSKTPTIRGVLWSNRYLKTNFRAGNKFFGIYTVPNRKVNTDFICFENVEQLKNSEYWNFIQIDLEKYIEMLYSKLSFILEPAGLNEYNEKMKNKILNEMKWRNGLGRWL